MAVPFAGFTNPADRGLGRRNADEPPLAIPVHTAVKGRLRLHVPYLLGSPRAKATIEQQFPFRTRVHHVSANPITGNVLVLYDPEIHAKHIIKTLEQIVDQFKNNGSHSKH